MDKTCWRLWELRNNIILLCDKQISWQSEKCSKPDKMLGIKLTDLVRVHTVSDIVCMVIVCELVLCAARASAGLDVWSTKCTRPWLLLRSCYQKQYIPQTITRRKEPDCYGYRKNIFTSPERTYKMLHWTKDEREWSRLIPLVYRHIWPFSGG